MINSKKFGSLLGIIHVGSTQCRFQVYAAENAEMLTCHEIRLTEINRAPGWIEYEPMEIWKAVLECMQVSINNLLILDINPADIIALGIANQRETIVLWDSCSGAPLYNAIAWCDTRTTGVLNNLLSRTRNRVNYLKESCGLPLSNYFSAVKVRWLMENVPEVEEAIQARRCLFGTLDSWVLWNLTGGVESGVHATDVTNASRTMLMNISTLDWDLRLCDFFRIPRHILPPIRSCAEVFGYVNAGLLSGVPVACCIGDQQAALLGQLCIEPGDVKCTYDDGCFMLFNTGQEIVDSDYGLLSTVAFKLGPEAPAFYALEGAVPNAGSAITWLRDTLKIPIDLGGAANCPANLLTHSLSDTQAISALCAFNKSVAFLNNNVRTQRVDYDLAFVPAFAGFYTPFWKSNARGLLAGLTAHTTPQQIVYATYEAIAFQTRQFLEALQRDCRSWPPVQRLRVGGETTDNNFLLQLIADLCGVTIQRPQIATPAGLGAMLAAGLAMRVLTLDTFRLSCVPPMDVFQATIGETQRDVRFHKWLAAVQKALNLEYDDNEDEAATATAFKERDSVTPVSHSIPGTVFLFSSFALLIVAQLLRASSAS